ncbi:MAG: hypothetical protein BXU00_00130 [Candidatus Nanoclepta minutus]|uniref:Small ribosomal subunit protein uS3 C-terminal domain-containing protein n=1 Tax=Candidatus Nanoclepta minutus TaxID=1940235 RepID=A0A397WN77_9ARCH|nr:MAG: hypothetical protein BXU00_00130 [Candidatus Nanoclepta minutus]
MATENLRKIIEHKKRETLLNFILKREFKGKLISRIIYFDTPLGEKILIFCARPRLVLGKANENLEKILNICKRIGFKNPQIEAVPVENPLLDANIVADLIASKIERQGARAARKIAMNISESVMKAGAIGIEIRITGKVIGERSSTIRIQKGKMKKSGEINKIFGTAISHAFLPQGSVGVKVKILPPNATLMDNIRIKKYNELDLEKLEKIDPRIIDILNKKYNITGQP